MDLEAFIGQHGWLFLLAALWTLPWKGVALWKAAHRNEPRWFVALLIVNTLAILEIFYILYWTKREKGGDPRFTRI